MTTVGRARTHGTNHEVRLTTRIPASGTYDNREYTTAPRSLYCTRLQYQCDIVAQDWFTTGTAKPCQAARELQNQQNVDDAGSAAEVPRRVPSHPSPVHVMVVRYTSRHGQWCDGQYKQDEDVHWVSPVARTTTTYTPDVARVRFDQWLQQAPAPFPRHPPRTRTLAVRRKCRPHWPSIGQ